MDDHGKKPTMKVIEKLDIEHEGQRHARIQSSLEKLNSESTSNNAVPQFGLPKFDFGDRTIHEVPPPTELLSRIRAFLPQMEASNALLTQLVDEDPTSVDIEHCSEDAAQYIEMNLGLGVFEDRSHGKTNREHDSEMSTSDSSDSDASSEIEIITSFFPSRPIKPLPRRSVERNKVLILPLDQHIPEQ